MICSLTLLFTRMSIFITLFHFLPHILPVCVTFERLFKGSVLADSLVGYWRKILLNRTFFLVLNWVGIFNRGSQNEVLTVLFGYLFPKSARLNFSSQYVVLQQIRTLFIFDLTLFATLLICRRFYCVLSQLS